MKYTNQLEKVKKKDYYIFGIDFLVIISNYSNKNIVIYYKYILNV